MIFRVALALLLFASVSCQKPGASDAPFILDHLKAGSYKVGFRSMWKLDTSRDYHFTENDSIIVPKQKRPILLNLWYPVKKAQGNPMPYKGYFNIEEDQPDFKTFSSTLRAFVLNVITQEIFDTAYEELDSANLEGFNQLMETSTSVFEDEPYPKGTEFPMVIYHAGAQSSYDDNSVLCEFLASHGYVVIGSAFQHDDGSTLSVDAGEGAFEDINFILKEAEKLGFIDTSNMSLIGHSLGAQMLLKYQATGVSKAKTIIPIDATFENHSKYDDLFWSELIGLLKENPDQFTNRFLAISGYDAFYQLYEKFDKTDRHYLSVDHLTHNEFITQGVLRKKLLEELGMESFEIDESYQTVSKQYAYVCEQILGFISGQKSEAYRSDSLRRTYEIQTKGSTSNWSDLSAPPTPREHFALYERHGIDRALAVLENYEHLSEESPLFEPDYGYGLVFDLIGSDKIEEARKVEVYFDRFNKGGIRRAFQRYIDIGERFGSDFIKDYFQSKVDLLGVNE